MPSYRLKSRNRPVPGGYGAYDSATNFKAGQHEDFETQCRGWQNARLANPGLTKRYRKSSDMDAIRAEVDEQWATFCRDHGYADFYVTLNRAGGGAEAAAAPFPRPTRPTRLSASAKLAALAVGGVVNIEWLASGAEAVPPEQANERARVCAGCGLNGKGGFESYFTNKAAAAIQKVVESKNRMKLSTPSDDMLGVCKACLCPLTLKVHVPLSKFIDKMTSDSKAALAEGCWIRAESAT